MCGETEARSEGNKNAKNAQRTQSVGEGKKAHPRDDQKVLPRQAQSERGGAVRRVQAALRIRALPPRKVSFQGQQKVLLLLSCPLLQAGYAGEDQGCDEVVGAENDIHASRVRIQTRFSDGKLQTQITKRGKGESKCLIGSF